MPSPKPHAVVVPWPGQGHINPLMHLSRKLASNGFTITFVNTEYNHSRVFQSHSEASKPLPEGQRLDIRFVSVPDGMPPEHSRMSDIPRLCKAITEEMRVGFEELMERLQHESPPVTCIISDVFVLHTQDVANKHGIPRVGFWTQCAASLATHLIVANGYHPPAETYKGEKVITCIPGAPPLRLKDMLTFLQPYDPSDFMFHFMTEPFLRINESVAVLMNSFDGLEEAAMAWLRKENMKPTLRTIGPILPPDFFTGSLKSKIGTALWQEDYDCLNWLDKHPPSSVLYVAFGSITVLSRQVIEEFAFGLEASGVPFLWVLRPGMIVDGEHSSVLPEGFRDRMKKRGLVITWAPQLHVLSHSSLGGFLTHGGWNSTLEGIAAGVPMVGFPYFTDQMLNCRCIEEEWKIGLALEPDENGVVSRVEVEKQVRAMMEDKKIREQSVKLRDAARRAVGEGGSSYKNIKAFIQEQA